MNYNDIMAAFSRVLGREPGQQGAAYWANEARQRGYGTADLERAIAYGAQGQDKIAANRYFVQRGIASPFQNDPIVQQAGTQAAPGAQVASPPPVPSQQQGYPPTNSQPSAAPTPQQNPSQVNVAPTPEVPPLPEGATSTVDPQLKQAYLENYEFAKGVANRPYQQYGGPRIADFTGEQLQGMDQMVNAAGQATPFLQGAGNTFQNLMGFNAPNVTAQGYNAQTVGTNLLGRAQDAQSRGYTAVTGQAANAGRASQASAQGYQSTDAARAYLGNAAQMGAAGIDRGNIQNVQAGSFLSGDINAYMNPYIQNVVDQNARDIERSRQLQQQADNANAISRGAFGGSRQAIMNAEGNRNALDTFARQSAQLRSQGFDTASGLMQSDLGRSLQAQQANQGMDYNVAAQNAGFQQQANQANQNAQNQFLMGQFQSDQALNQFNAQNRNQAAQFGAQAQNTANLANQAANNQMAQYNAGNQQAMNIANMGAQNQAAQFGAGAFNTASLANQAAQNQFAMQNQQAMNQSNQFNANAMNSANSFLAGAQNQASMQNANNAMNAAGIRSGAATNYAGIGNAMYQNAMAGAQNRLAVGQMQQDMNQRNYDLAYNDFQNQWNYPLQQLQIRSAGLGQSVPNFGIAMPGQQVQTNGTAQNVGLALAGLGVANNVFGNGGFLSNYNPFA